jgi:hypothetical protein
MSLFPSGKVDIPANRNDGQSRAVYRYAPIRESQPMTSAYSIRKQRAAG